MITCKDCDKLFNLDGVKLKTVPFQSKLLDRMELKDFLKVDKNKVQSLLKWDARLHLGNKIKSCIEKNNQCHFEAEL